MLVFISTHNKKGLGALRTPKPPFVLTTGVAVLEAACLIVANKKREVYNASRPILLFTFPRTNKKTLLHLSYF
jgi:hypothetical protein